MCRWMWTGSSVVLMAAGCSYAPAPERAQLERGYLMLLTGVECYGSYHREFVEGLRDAGIDYAIEINEWGDKPFGTFQNLRNYELNRRRAGDIARRLTEYAAAEPGRAITLMGYSGGGAMALFVAEALPSGFKVDRILLTGAAISPGYDITPALEHSRLGLVSFYSEQDWFMAGMATTLWGTMDRKKTATAGRLGFRTSNEKLREEAGLVQVPWVEEWRALGHEGGHSGWRARRWAREVLAPWVRLPLATPTAPAVRVES